MGSCCSSDVKVSPQTHLKGENGVHSTKKSENIKNAGKTKKDNIKDLIYYLEDPNEKGNLHLKDFNRKDVDALSMLRTVTGKSMVFTAPDKVQVLTHTPPNAATYVNIEETFWPKKRKLIPDYRVMERIDQHALKASPDLKNSAQRLVEYLIKPCKNDVEKARALIRWMGENIQYNTHYLETGDYGDLSVEGVLKSGQAICDGYSTVLSHFGELAGLQCEKISGQSKSLSYYPGCFDADRLSDCPGVHAWNALKLDGEWYLCDATWAAGSVGNKGGRHTFSKEWNEMYFLSDPTYFVLTHLPLDGNQILPDKQHLQEPITVAKTWANLALITPQAGVFGVRPITHKESVIQVPSGELTLKYACSSQLSQWVAIEKIEPKGKGTVAMSGPKFDDMVSLFTIEDRGLIIARFQETGMYDIEIVGNIKNGHAALQLPMSLIRYRVNVSKPTKKPQLPGGSNCKWGIQKEFIDAGFKVLYPKDCLIKTSSGLAIVKVQLPTNGHLPNMHRLYMTEGKNTKSEHNGYVIAGQRGNVITYYVQCPKVGEYRLEVYAKYEDESVGFYVGAGVLITSTKANANPLKVDINNKCFGVYDDFHKLGLLISSKSTILKAKDGQARLRLKKTRPVKFLKHLDLITSEKKEADVGDVDLTEEGDVITFNATLPQQGFFILSLFATEAASTGSYPMVARFGISNGSHI